MIFDKIFIINLKHRTDRKEFIINQLEKQNINKNDYEFFEAIRPNIDEVNIWNKNFCSHHTTDLYRIGCLGCLVSHVSVIRAALMRGYKNILVLEDDTEFTDNLDKLYTYSQQIDNNYDMLYLSGSHMKSTTPITNNVHKVNCTYTTGSYCIKENAMKFLKENIEGYSKEIDVFYAHELQPKFNCYTVYPHITKQMDGFSDIQQKTVKYKLKNISVDF